MKQEKKDKKVSVFTILIFVMCGLLAVYTVISIVSVTAYIKEMIAYGSITVSDNLIDIITYYMSNCGTIIIYICLFLAIWWTKRSITAKPQEVRSVETVFEEIDLLDETEGNDEKKGKAEDSDTESNADKKDEAESKNPEK